MSQSPRQPTPLRSIAARWSGLRLAVLVSMLAAPPAFGKADAKADAKDSAAARRSGATATARATARILRPVAIRNGKVVRGGERLLLVHARPCRDVAASANDACREYIIDLQ